MFNYTLNLEYDTQQSVDVKTGVFKFKSMIGSNIRFTITITILFNGGILTMIDDVERKVYIDHLKLNVNKGAQILNMHWVSVWSRHLCKKCR